MVVVLLLFAAKYRGFFVSVAQLRDALERCAGKFPGERLQWAAFVRFVGR